MKTTIAALMLVTACASRTRAEDPAIVAYWQQDRARIDRELAQYRAGPLASAGDRDAVPLQDHQAGILDTDRDALDVQLRRVRALLSHLERSSPVDLVAERKELDRLEVQVRQTAAERVWGEKRSGLYRQCRALTRRIALANPLLDFDAIIFNTFEHQIAKNNVMNHDQDVGYSAAPGGGIGVLEGLQTGAPQGRNLLSGVTIQNGPDQGREIATAGGSFNSYDLSFDGRRVVFAWSRRGQNPRQTWTPFEADFWTEDNTFHLFTYEIGRKTCRQLTFGNRSDHSPCWLPNGRIVFMSERRNTAARCAMSRHQPTSAMYGIRADGEDMIRLSWHDTEEWDPSVTNDGMLVYTRWDYLDRDFHAAHHLWICYPDGRDPRAPHGNYALPHSTLELDRWEDGRAWRPWGEYNIRAVAGSGRFIAIAGGHHHTGVYGAPILVDVRVPDDGRNSQITRITPGDRWINEACPPNDAQGDVELTGGNRRDDCLEQEHYGYPWALSEDFYLVTEGQDPFARIFLLDKFGNRVVLYSGTGIPGVSGFRVVNPMPYRARTRPPVIPTGTWQGERRSARAPLATISVANVYESDFDWPPGTEIKSLRVIQHVPKPWSSPVADQPKLGYARSPTARVVLGTVPVEPDGSVYFEAPVERLIYFQALDAEGMAIQSMRSGTYVHPGEQLSCVGCHEDKWRAPQLPGTPLAMLRAPSKLRPEVGGVEPINFHRLVRPVLESKCVDCHQQRKADPDFSYASLEPYAFYFHADGGANHMSRLHGGSRTIAGKFGARYSRLVREGYLSSQHYGLQLSASERRRITLWLDTNSLELPSFSLDPQVVERARRGELVWPLLDVGPLDRLIGNSH